MGNEPIEKVSIIISKGSLEGVYPGLIMANGARAEGIEANLFFTFFGLDVIHRKRGAAHQARDGRQPGPAPPDPARRHPGGGVVDDTLHGAPDREARHPVDPRVRRDDRGHGRGLYACKASVDLFGMTPDDFIPQVEDIITVGEFYDRAAGGQIIFT